MRIFKTNPLLSMINSYIIDSAQPLIIRYMWNMGTLLAFSVLQIFTGITLAMHYNTSIVEAFNSVYHIIADINNQRLFIKLLLFSLVLIIYDLNNGWLLGFRFIQVNTVSTLFSLYYLPSRCAKFILCTIGTIILAIVFFSILFEFTNLYSYILYLYTYIQGMLFNNSILWDNIEYNSIILLTSSGRAGKVIYLGISKIYVRYYPGAPDRYTWETDSDGNRRITATDKVSTFPLIGSLGKNEINSSFENIKSQDEADNLKNRLNAQIILEGGADNIAVKKQTDEGIHWATGCPGFIKEQKDDIVGDLKNTIPQNKESLKRSTGLLLDHVDKKYKETSLKLDTDPQSGTVEQSEDNKTNKPVVQSSDNKPVEPSSNQSPLDYVIEKQSTEMPDICDSDGGD